MSDQAAPTRPSKWWGASLTIWGAVMTALSTVLPVVGPLVGLDIPPELIHQLGDEVILLAQAVAGLSGTILTIYGRARATTALRRRRPEPSVRVAERRGRPI